MTLLKTIHFKNSSISYSDEGKGTAVVLLHGFLENKKMWNAFVPEFCKKYRIITIDLLGHGNSEPLGYVHSMEDNVVVQEQGEAFNMIANIPIEVEEIEELMNT